MTETANPIGSALSYVWKLQIGFLRASSAFLWVQRVSSEILKKNVLHHTPWQELALVNKINSCKGKALFTILRQHLRNNRTNDTTEWICPRSAVLWSLVDSESSISDTDRFCWGCAFLPCLTWFVLYLWAWAYVLLLLLYLGAYNLLIYLSRANKEQYKKTKQVSTWLFVK